MEESIYTKREKSNKIFENNENLQTLIGSKNNHLNSTIDEINRGTVNNTTRDKRTISEDQKMS